MSTAIEIGNTVEGTVVKLADYGAIVRLAGGKIVERWNVRDLLSLLQQLGVDVGI